MNRRNQLAQIDQENDSSGLGATTDNNPIGLNDGSLDMGMMVRGSITNIDNGYTGNGAGQIDPVNKSSDDLTLDMLGPTSATAMTLMPPSQPTELHQNAFIPPITSKNPPSSALNLHANLDRDSRANLQQNNQQQNPYA